jgi:hypothetical protein
MGNAGSQVKTVNFDNIKEQNHLLINVMDETDQSVLIKGTVHIENEIKTINPCLKY